MGKFTAIAYWNLGNVTPGWTVAAEKAIEPLKGWAEMEVQNAQSGSGQEQMSIRLPGAQATLLVTSGRARGSVPADNPRAIELVVVLMALRRVIPTMSLADDDGKDIPQRLSQSYPLFGNNWEAVQDIGERLGIMPSKHFFETMGLGVLSDLMF